MKKSRKIAALTLLWCIKTLKMNPVVPGKPRLNYYANRYNAEKKAMMGYYHSNNKRPQITIFPLAIKNTKELIITVIHEYIHYLQDSRVDRYDILLDLVSYAEHPHELEANMLSEYFYKECFAWIKEICNRFK